MPKEPSSREADYRSEPYRGSRVRPTTGDNSVASRTAGHPSSIALTDAYSLDASTNFDEDVFNANASLYWEPDGEGVPQMGEPGSGGNTYEKAKSTDMHVSCRVTFGNKVDKFRVLFCHICTSTCLKPCPKSHHPSCVAWVDIASDWSPNGGSEYEAIMGMLESAMQPAPVGSGWSLSEVGFRGREGDWCAERSDNGDIQQACKAAACDQIMKWRSTGARPKVPATE
ncbi:hypothetical protein QFC20_007548 [Naganishia adeliensis]|uniref:Uncharacterized protein n=1 Tax=Naganishia adeliensis TaxID=92952 RepID=A0ACC2UZ66_9TREE|nr:hypothetical protein QFC20_007548 [Naganishia adeliensis]